jgi:hypothetical protein
MELIRDPFRRFPEASDIYKKTLYVETKSITRQTAPSRSSGHPN